VNRSRLKLFAEKNLAYISILTQHVSILIVFLEGRQELCRKFIRRDKRETKRLQESLLSDQCHHDYYYGTLVARLKRDSKNENTEKQKETT
jgi:hypothetical protein